MTKIQELENDIEQFKDCVKGIMDEIERLKNTNNPDHYLIAQKVENMKGVRKLLEKSMEELDVEKLRDQNQPNDDKLKKDQATFDKKSNSYSVVRTSYVKSEDN
jgi:hypothetical protein